MVTNTTLPHISWEENFGPEDMHRVSDIIVETITNVLTVPTDGRKRLFFVVPTPPPYVKAEVELLAAANASDAAKALRVVKLTHKGRCYAISSEKQFRALIPHAFHLGPPELTFIAANCGFDLAATESEIANFVLNVLEDVSFVATGDLVGMHFDSGDLVELFRS